MENEIIVHKGGGVTLSGEDAVAMYRARLLVSSLRMYASCGMIPTRGVTITKMLKLATEITHKPYKRGDALRAAADVETWANEMHAALPITKEG